MVFVSVPFLTPINCSRETPRMGHQPRVVDAGPVYHAHNRGNNRADVFADDEDHAAFLKQWESGTQRNPIDPTWHLSHSNRILGRRMTPRDLR